MFYLYSPSVPEFAWITFVIGLMFSTVGPRDCCRVWERLFACYRHHLYNLTFRGRSDSNAEPEEAEGVDTLS